MDRYLINLDKMIKLQINNFQHQHHSQMEATIYINFKNRTKRAYSWKNQICKAHRIKIKVYMIKILAREVFQNKCLKKQISNLIINMHRKHLKIIMAAQNLIN